MNDLDIVDALLSACVATPLLGQRARSLCEYPSRNNLRLVIGRSPFPDVITKGKAIKRRTVDIQTRWYATVRTCQPNWAVEITNTCRRQEREENSASPRCF